MGKIAYRRVAPDWEHPVSRRDGSGYQPLHDGMLFQKQYDQWKHWEQLWEQGQIETERNGRTVNEPIPDDAFAAGIAVYYGQCPDPKDYSPQWTPEQATAWQVYEEVSEGTPISCVYPSLDMMAETIAKECGHNVAAMRNKILATLERGYWYIPVPEFDVGGKYHGQQFKEV